MRNPSGKSENKALFTEEYGLKPAMVDELLEFDVVGFVLPHELRVRNTADEAKILTSLRSNIDELPGLRGFCLEMLSSGVNVVNLIIDYMSGLNLSVAIC